MIRQILKTLLNIDIEIRDHHGTNNKNSVSPMIKVLRLRNV